MPENFQSIDLDFTFTKAMLNSENRFFNMNIFNYKIHIKTFAFSYFLETIKYF